MCQLCKHEVCLSTISQRLGTALKMQTDQTKACPLVRYLAVHIKTNNGTGVPKTAIEKISVSTEAQGASVSRPRTLEQVCRDVLHPAYDEVSLHMTVDG